MKCMTNEGKLFPSLLAIAIIVNGLGFLLSKSPNRRRQFLRGSLSEPLDKKYNPKGSGTELRDVTLCQPMTRIGPRIIHPIRILNLICTIGLKSGISNSPRSILRIHQHGLSAQHSLFNISLSQITRALRRHSGLNFPNRGQKSIAI